MGWRLNETAPSKSAYPRHRVDSMCRGLHTGPRGRDEVRLKNWIAAVVSVAAMTGGAAAQNINAAGATFPYPIYNRWFTEYAQAHPNVKINYQSIGSGGGIKQVTEGTVDFGASDAIMTDDQIAQAEVKVMALPTVLGAVVP